MSRQGIVSHVLTDVSQNPLLWFKVYSILILSHLTIKPFRCLNFDKILLYVIKLYFGPNHTHKKKFILTGNATEEEAQVPKKTKRRQKGNKKGEKGNRKG